VDISNVNKLLHNWHADVTFVVGGGWWLRCWLQTRLNPCVVAVNVWGAQ